MCDAGKTWLSKSEVGERRECDKQGRWKAWKWYPLSMSDSSVQGMQRTYGSVCGCVGVWVHGCVYMDPPLTELSWTLSVQSEPWGGCSDFSCPHYAAPSHFWLGGYKLCRRQIQSCVCINMHANAWFQGAVIPFDSLSWVWWGLIDDWKNIKACSVGVEAPCCDCWCVVLWNCLLYQSLHPAAS